MEAVSAGQCPGEGGVTQLCRQPCNHLTSSVWRGSERSCWGDRLCARRPSISSASIPGRKGWTVVRVHPLPLAYHLSPQ